MVVKEESNGSRRIQSLDSASTTIGFSFYYHWILLLLPLDSPSTTIGFSFYYHWILLLLPLDSPSTTIGFSFKENPMVLEGEYNGSKRRIQW
jgi:hypothetical protein